MNATKPTQIIIADDRDVECCCMAANLARCCVMQVATLRWVISASESKGPLRDVTLFQPAEPLASSSWRVGREGVTDVGWSEDLAIWLGRTAAAA